MAIDTCMSKKELKINYTNISELSLSKSHCNQTNSSSTYTAMYLLDYKKKIHCQYYLNDSPIIYNYCANV